MYSNAMAGETAGQAAANAYGARTGICRCPSGQRTNEGGAEKCLELISRRNVSAPRSMASAKECLPAMAARCLRAVVQRAATDCPTKGDLCAARRPVKARILRAVTFRREMDGVVLPLVFRRSLRLAGFPLCLLA